MNTVMRRLRCIAFCVALFAPIVVSARVYTLPAGVALNGVLQQALDSKTTAAGSPFSMYLTPPFPNNMLRGATVQGHVASIQKAGQGTEPRITLAFNRIVFANGTAKPIEAQLVKDQVVPDKSGRETNAIARGVAGLIGPAHGIGVSLFARNHKDNIHIPKSSTVVIELTKPVTL